MTPAHRRFRLLASTEMACQADFGCNPQGWQDPTRRFFACHGFYSGVSIAQRPAPGSQPKSHPKRHPISWLRRKFPRPLHFVAKSHGMTFRKAKFDVKASAARLLATNCPPECDAASPCIALQVPRQATDAPQLTVPPPPPSPMDDLQAPTAAGVQPGLRQNRRHRTTRYATFAQLSDI